VPPEPPVDTLDPEALEEFLTGLSNAGYVPSADRCTWTGPAPGVLKPFTDAGTMVITLRPGWPYQAPRIDVEGIDSWHADQDHLCLWQPGDNTRRWMTLDGILKRIDEWVAQAETGFENHEGAALDPHLYFSPNSFDPIAIDVDELIAGAYQDGQHGILHVAPYRPAIPRLAAGRLAGAAGATHGRWFYRDDALVPPANLGEFEETLTDGQRRLYLRDLERLGHAIFALIWPTKHGLAPLVVMVEQSSQSRLGAAYTPVPTTVEDRLRRAGPDASTLQSKQVVLFGVGAIGSHVASLLARSGIGKLTLVDADRLFPAGEVRHLTAADKRELNKALLTRDALAGFDWTTIEVVDRCTWEPTELAGLIRDADLAVDATGLTPFAELLSRVAAALGIDLISVALFRGGAVARVRRQAAGDTPIVGRQSDWRYPPIPADDPAEVGGPVEYVGVEAGCVAPIHNAPPSCVVLAAAEAVLAATDLLSGRRALSDEVVEVIEPIELPFDIQGRLRLAPPAVLVTDQARSTMVAAARNAHPKETGGVLVGLPDATGAPVVAQAIEVPAEVPSAQRYDVPAGATSKAVEHVRKLDDRLGYLGEWHSHPSDQPASSTDQATMRALASHPDTGAPVLIVMRPIGDDQFEPSAYLTIGSKLHKVTVEAVGPIPESKADKS
jgi:proteasome lid subunit RPN8/RPN11